MSCIKWNPFHGCTKVSAGCQNCYVYRMDKRFGRNPSEFKITNSYWYPVHKRKDNTYEINSGNLILTCFTSDFLIKDADEYRIDLWGMMKERSDNDFLFITKRIDRLKSQLPDDWNGGYDNVFIMCTVENQEMADYRIPIFLDIPMKWRGLCVEPILEEVDLTKYLDKIDFVIIGGESGPDARICNIKWIESLKHQCNKHTVPMCFKQTGARFVNRFEELEKVARCDQFEYAHGYGMNNFHIDRLDTFIHDLKYIRRSNHEKSISSTIYG